MKNIEKRDRLIKKKEEEKHRENVKIENLKNNA